MNFCFNSIEMKNDDIKYKRNKSIESHNNDSVEEVDQVETSNNNTKSITRQCGTCNDIFQILKDLSAKNLIHLTIFVVNVTINPITIGCPPLYYNLIVI